MIKTVLTIVKPVSNPCKLEAVKTIALILLNYESAKIPGVLYVITVIL